jgi:type III secretory pathway component EscU
MAISPAAKEREKQAKLKSLRKELDQEIQEQLEEKNAEASLVSVRQQIIVGVREAVRRVQTDFKRIERKRRY